MITIPFYKYQATGNDFILLDHTDKPVISTEDTSLIQALCNRHVGIGSDGIIVIQKRKGYDFEMGFFNPDGSTSFCGNGSRCAVHWAYRQGLIDTKSLFLSTDGPHQAWVEEEQIQVYLADVPYIKKYQGAYIVDTGSPHYICLTTQLTTIDVDSLGKAINQREIFRKRGINVTFVQLEPSNQLSMRTYERGVLAETLSCGTGAVAAALVAAQVAKYATPIRVKTRGGSVEVGFKQQTHSYSNIYLAGPATLVFQGQYYTDLPTKT